MNITPKERADMLRSLAQNEHMIGGNYLPMGNVLNDAAYRIESDAKDAEKDAALQEIGECAASSLAEMVAALECDYDRLEELKEERETATETVTECESDLSLEIYDDATAKGILEVKRDYARTFLTDTEEEFKELTVAAGDCESREDAEQRIQEDPLSLEVRGDWHSYGDVENLNEPGEFCILLGTGGPATRIIGELRDNEPHRARLQVQDWGTPWTDYRGGAISHDDLLTYCRCFYFGE